MAISKADQIQAWTRFAAAAVPCFVANSRDHGKHAAACAELADALVAELVRRDEPEGDRASDAGWYSSEPADVANARALALADRNVENVPEPGKPVELADRE